MWKWEEKPYRAQVDHLSRWLLATVGLQLPPSSLQLHFKGEKRLLWVTGKHLWRVRWLSQVWTIITKCPINTFSDGWGHLSLLIVFHTEMEKPLTTHDRFIWLALQNSSIKAHAPHIPHLQLCQSKGAAKRKVPRQDCPHDSQKIPQGDILGYLPQEVGQMVLVTSANSATWKLS